MNPLDEIILGAQPLSEQQIRELLAMAKGMDAANKIAEEQGA